MSDHPWPVGTRVSHTSQQWHRSRMGGTGYIVGYDGPYNDGSYEYNVMAGEDFARQTGPDNPETRLTLWSSLTVHRETGITSVSGSEFDSSILKGSLRNVVGPNPRGSHLSDNGRFHLLFLVANVSNSEGQDRLSSRDELLEFLKGRDITPEQLDDMFREGRSPVQVTDALCVHGSMRIGESSYLD